MYKLVSDGCMLRQVILPQIQIIKAMDETRTQRKDMAVGSAAICCNRWARERLVASLMKLDLSGYVKCTVSL